MLSKHDPTSKDTYGFDFKNPTKLDYIATIKAVGIEQRSQENGYFWDCRLREETNVFVFQYTLSGCGEIRINGKTHLLPEQHAFMIQIPENCQYYIPSSSNDWKFIFITLSGEEVKNCWNYINSTHGHVFQIALKKRIIQQLVATYTDVQNGQLLDIYQVSQKAYEFLSLCYRHFETRIDSLLLSTPPDVEKALHFIKENFTNNLNVDDISEQTGLSKSHLTRKFKNFTGYSPLNYLNKYRIEQASYLLQHTQKTVKEISADVGFTDSNYFCKAFRKMKGMSPNSLRKTKDSQQNLGFLITESHGIIDLD